MSLWLDKHIADIRDIVGARKMFADLVLGCTTSSLTKIA